MKKIFLLLCSGIVFFAACSEESSVDTTKSVNAFKAKEGVVDLSSKYKEMLESTEYADLQKSVVTFMSKLHFDHSVKLEKTADLLAWSKDNISKTDFKDYNEFFSQWTGIVEKQSLVMTKYEGFYSGIVDNYPNVDFEISTNSNQPTDNCSCMPALNNCYYNAFQQQKAGIIGAMAIEGLFGISRTEGVALAECNYNDAIAGCNYVYDVCMGYCK